MNHSLETATRQGVSGSHVFAAAASASVPIAMEPTLVDARLYSGLPGRYNQRLWG